MTNEELIKEYKEEIELFEKDIKQTNYNVYLNNKERIENLKSKVIRLEQTLNDNKENGITLNDEFHKLVKDEDDVAPNCGCEVCSLFYVCNDMNTLCQNIFKAEHHHFELTKK